MDFSKEIPDTLVPSVGYGVIIGGAQASLQFSVLRKAKEIFPLSWQLTQTSYFTESASYLVKLEQVLYGLTSRKHGHLLNESTIVEILEYEKSREINRGSEAPFFRALVLYMLNSFAIHVRDAFFVGFHQDYSGHLMIIRNALVLGRNENISINEFSRSRIFFNQDVKYPSGKIIMLEATAIIMQVNCPRKQLFQLLSSWVDYIRTQDVKEKTVELFQAMLHSLNPSP